jgi:hypothetical protein
MKNYVRFLLAGFLILHPMTAYSQESQTRNMSFAECLATIRNVSAQLGVAPIIIVDTSILRMVRFPTITGSVLVTCSRPDRTMVLTVTDN